MRRVPLAIPLVIARSACGSSSGGPQGRSPISLRAAVLLAVGLSVTAATAPDVVGAAPSATSGAITAATTPNPHASTIHITTTSAPPGFDKPKGQWLRITRADGKTQLAEVFRPGTAGRHPLIVVLHGASGLARIQLSWAANFAHKGYIVVAGCYLNALEGSPPHTYVPCPSLPDITDATTSAIRRSYAALLDAAATLKGTKAHATAAIGMSYGANVALNGSDTRVKAIVADSGYRDTPGTTNTPVLLLGFSKDPNVPHSNLVAFERAQRRAGKSIESHYYPGANHVALLTRSTTNDATARTVEYLRRRVGSR